MNIAEITKTYQLPLVETVKKGTPRSERDEVLEQIVTKLNECRVKAGFKKLSYPAVAKQLKRAGITPEGYWAFYQRCESFNSFSAGFYTLLSPRKYELKSYH